MTLPFDLGAGGALWLASALLAAAFVRGYSGFGFAALVVAASSLVTNPMNLVPVVVLADVLMTVQQAMQIRTAIDWRRSGTLFAGALAGVPVGVWALNGIGVDTVRAVISVYVLVMCGVLLSGWHFLHAVGDAGHVATGLVSGLANGAAVGGLPVAAFFAAQPVAAVTFRATLIAYFTLLDLWTLPLMWANGMFVADTFKATLMAAPLLVLGIWAGGRHFVKSEPQSFRRFAIYLLATLAVLGLMKSVL